MFDNRCHIWYSGCGLEISRPRVSSLNQKDSTSLLNGPVVGEKSRRFSFLGLSVNPHSARFVFDRTIRAIISTKRISVCLKAMAGFP